METKKCSKCGKIKTADLFYKNSKNKDGLQGWCKDCALAYLNVPPEKRGKNIPFTPSVVMTLLNKIKYLTMNENPSLNNESLKKINNGIRPNIYIIPYLIKNNIISRKRAWTIGGTYFYKWEYNGDIETLSNDVFNFAKNEKLKYHKKCYISKREFKHKTKNMTRKEAILYLYNKENKTQNAIAKYFGISKAYVNKVVNQLENNNIQQEEIINLNNINKMNKQENELFEIGKVLVNGGLSITVIDPNDVVFCKNTDDKTEKILVLNRKIIIEKGFRELKKPVKLTAEQIKEKFGIEDFEII